MSDSLRATFSALCSSLKARVTSDNQAKARCPVHQGRTATSLSLTLTSAKILVYCHRGCDWRDILAAVDIEPSVLFGAEPQKAVLIKARALEGLDVWAARELLGVCDFLRAIDSSIAIAHELGECESSMDILDVAYQKRRGLENRFSVLNGPSAQATADLWRESRR